MHTFPSCLLGDPLNTDRLLQKCRHPFAVLYTVGRSFGSPSTFTALFIITYIHWYALSLCLSLAGSLVHATPFWNIICLPATRGCCCCCCCLVVTLCRTSTHTVIGWLKKSFTIISKRPRHGLLMYSDTSANEDNSFRNHIRWPKSSLAETWFPVGFYRKSFNSFWMLPTI